jgi:hypothetical protein
MAATQTTGKTDPAAILDALRLILAPGQVTELRALDASTVGNPRPHVEAGYFDDPEKLARAAAGIAQAKGIYFIPNPVNPALLARAVNRVRPAPKGESTGDGDILRRWWLLLDADPVRPAGIASTDAEHQAALDRTQAIAADLAALGWPSPIAADSGNGAHLLYRIDLAPDDGGLVKRCLEALAVRYDDDAVKIDRTVFNPSRIWKLYGTVAGKGDAAAAAIGRPHRLARVLTAPEVLAAVPCELLEALAAAAPAPPPPRHRGHADTGARAAAPRAAFDVDGWLRRHNLDATGPEDWRSADGQMGRRWVFAVCPWDSNHTNGSAFIVQFANGAVAAGCHHNGCARKDWPALRDLFGEPEARLDPAKFRARFDAALATVKSEGVEVLYRDGELMHDLARLAEEDKDEFACVRAAARAATVRLRDLDAALTPRRQELRAAKPAPSAAGDYRVVGGRIVHVRATPHGPVEVPLANWSARIVEEVVHDDGAERRITFAVEGALAGGTPLPRAEVAADKFPWMRWPVEAWGTRAVVLAGASTADHCRAAVQLLSGEVPRRVVYEHTGWREIGGCWCYLHAGGAIGPGGAAPGVEVHLPDALAGYVLPAPPDGAELAAAVRASLSLLDVAPERIMAPLLGAVYRAVLGAADYALHLCGPTGAGKTELAALGQQHYGAGMDARRLPGSWASTGNSLEFLAFAAASALLVVDDFAPGGGVADVARIHREADRLLRAQGNRSGRARCRTDGTARPARPPRGTIVSTGEDVPRGQSLRARLLVLELAPGELDWGRLTSCQREAGAGLYAQALAGLCRWLAPRYGTARDELRTETAALRERVHAEGLHARTPGIIADLAAGWRYWLDFALAAGALDAAERAALARRVWHALLDAAGRQAEHDRAAEPCSHFLRLLAGALASGRAHVADRDGCAPLDAAAWGWREVVIGTSDNQREEWQEQGRRIGWIDGTDLYLEPEASYAEAQELARHQGDALPVSPKTLRRRLRERGLLASSDLEREVLTVRRTLEGTRREVLHLRAVSLYTGPDQPDQSPANPGETGRVDGRVRANPTNEPDQKPGANGQLVGLVGSDAGGERSAEGNSTTSNGEPGDGTWKDGRWYAPGSEGLRTPFDDV